jgi:hydrogenase maturation protease
MTPLEPDRKPALVLGVGNILWADEGFGVRCVEAFAQAFAGREDVTVADGGTQGLYLVELLREHDPVVVFDAVDFGDAPGAMRLVRDEAIPAFVGAHKLSLHQAGLQDVIACARLLGDCAERMLLVGVQPVELEDYGGSLRPAVRKAIPRALAIAAEFLAEQGFPLQAPDRANRNVARGAAVMTPGLDLASYEGGRPSEDLAPRHGDARVLSRTGSA